MKIIEQSHKIMEAINGKVILNKIEAAGRTCYKSEDRIGLIDCPKCKCVPPGFDKSNCKWSKWHHAQPFNDTPQVNSSLKFADTLLHQYQHESVIEHDNITVKFITDRGISHELVRHRICSFSQESSRYCNYSKDKFGNEISIIRPVWITNAQIAAVRKEDENSTSSYPFPEDYDPKVWIWLECMKRIECDYFDLIAQGWKPEEARSVLPNSLKTEIVMTANIREWRHVFKTRCSKKAHPQIRELMRPLLKDFQDRIPVLFDDLKGE